jgi:selenocysteine-specific elongation factor
LDDAPAFAAAVLAEAGATQTAAELARRIQWPTERTQDILVRLVDEGLAIEAAGNAYAHDAAVEAAAVKLVDALKDFHEAHPLRAGAPRGELFASIEADSSLLAVAEARLVSHGRVKSGEELLTLVGQGAKLSEADRELAARIEATLAEAGVEPPRPDQLAEQLAAPLDRIEAMLQLLCDEGRVVRLDEKVAMAAQAVEQAKQVVLELFEASSGFDTMAFRDALGVSRKFAVPLLDYFDTQKLTVRTGNRRTPGAQAREAMDER